MELSVTESADVSTGIRGSMMAIRRGGSILSPTSMVQAVTKEYGRCGFSAFTNSHLLGWQADPSALVPSEYDGYAAGLFLNPSGSDVDASIDYIGATTDTPGMWSRIVTPSALDYSSAHKSTAVMNRGGGTNQPKSQLYCGKNLKFLGGKLVRQVWSAAQAPVTASLYGSMVVRPGQSLLWKFKPRYGQLFYAPLEITWWETAADS